MTARWFTFLVWAAAAASGMFWGLKVLVKPPPVPPQVQVVTGQGAPRGDLTRLLGVDAAPAEPGGSQEPPADGRFSLIGVVSPRAKQAAGEGVALISVDGKPAKAFRIGAVVDGDTVLQSVDARGAALGPRNSPALIALQLAPLPAAATGTLPPPGSAAAPPPPPRTFGMPPVMPPGAQPAGAAPPPPPPINRDNPAALR